MYKKVGGKASKLQYIPVNNRRYNKPYSNDYWSYRMGQIRSSKTPLYYTEGKFKGMPTKQHIILIMIIFDWLIHQIKIYIKINKIIFFIIYNNGL